MHPEGAFDCRGLLIGWAGGWNEWLPALVSAWDDSHNLCDGLRAGWLVGDRGNMRNRWPRPDVLLIMGTSLATHGVQLLIKDFARVIHKKRAGKVVFVNLTEPAKSWNGVIDYWVKWDCDTWVGDLMKRQPALCRGNNERLIPEILIDLTKEDGQLDDKSLGSSRENPINLTL
ncbi:hypothetical protein VTK56DRAFT_6038 [Thermocarpiscus australiensis]